jgi:hypothetical protein
MISNILELLRYAKGETENINIRIAQGKYKIPQTIKEGYKQIKQEIWQKRST